MKDEYVECTMTENTATLLDEASAFILGVTSQGLELFTRSTSTQTLK